MYVYISSEHLDKTQDLKTYAAAYVAIKLTMYFCTSFPV